MKKHNDYTAPFGNKIPFASVCFARFRYYLCRFLFAKDDTPVVPAAVPAGEAYNDFGMLTIVDKNKTTEPVQDINPEHALIIGTVRMGFGHWRMAIAMASAAHHLGYTPYLLDILSFDGSTAQKSIRFLEYWYDVFSRISQKSKWFNKYIWERATSTGGRSLKSCVYERCLSQLFTPIFINFQKDIPLLSMHPWIGHAAVLCGMKNIVSIIPDNLPLAFWLVEGTRHTVQSPSAYMGYRTLISMDTKYPITNCIPQSALTEAGHYVDYEIVSTIEQDCDKRLERCKRGKARRFLLTMGGAGAQAERFADIINTCRSSIETDKAVFFVNMGDHKGRWTELRDKLTKEGITYTLHSDWEQTKQFVKKADSDDINGIHIFLHNDFYAAVYLTNLLMHVSDIMITKPSELSFYPVPKLFIQRVGRHEAWGAIRGSEIGDGTIETDCETDLHRTLLTLINSSDLLEIYIRHIRLNAAAGVYNGAYNAVAFTEIKDKMKL
ncbi:MAG: hypothetical protein M0P01_07890 [Treponema sp.]|nr:hypothetical protein [Treponema sp.]